MLRNQNSLDYEPLTRRRSKSRNGDHARDESAPFSDFDARFEGEGPAKQDINLTPQTVIPSSPPKEQRSELWIGRRGHSLSFVGLVIFTFLVYIRPYELSPSLFWLSKGALITAIATLIVFVPTQLGLENRLTIRTREVNLVLALLVFGLLSVPLATDKSLAWDSFVEFFKVIVIFVVMVNVVRTAGRLKLLLLLALIASCIVSIGAIQAYWSGDLAIGGTRIAGVLGNLFQNPNDLALHLVTFFPIVIALALAARNPFSGLLYLLAAIGILGGTVVTFSRSGFLGIIAVAASLCWLLLRKSRALVMFATIVLVGLLLVLAPGGYRKRIATTSDDSAIARAGELKRSIYIALRHPIFGVGMNNYVVYSDTEHATHNAYTQVASEMGLAAAAVYILFLITALKRVKRVPHPKDVDKNSRSLPYLAIGLQASLIGYMVTSFFASVAYLWYVYYLVAYVICVGRLSEVTGLTKSVQTREK